MSLRRAPWSSAAILLAACASHEELPRRGRPSPPLEAAPVVAPPAGGFVGLEVASNESESLEDLEFFPGVRVIAVVPNSPAERAGLETGDVVLSIDGRAVSRGEAFRALVSAAPPGSPLRLEVQRGEGILEVEVPVVLREEGEALAPVAFVEEERVRARFRDIVLLEEGGRRLAVEIVALLPASPLEAAGVRPGDRVVSLDGREVSGARDLVAAIREGYAGDERVRLGLERGGRRLERRIRLAGRRRVLTGLALPPLFTYRRETTVPRTRFWLGDFFVFSLFRYDRRGEEVEVRLLSLFGWSTGRGVLSEDGS